MSALNHATLRRASRCRPGLVGCLPRCVRTDGRVKLCGEIVPTLAEPRTANFRAVGAQRGALTLTPDVRPVAPTSIGWPIWHVLGRARPCECHATTAHVTAAAVGVCWHHHPRTDRTPPAGTLPPVVSNVKIHHLIIGISVDLARVGPRSRRGMLSTTNENPQV